MVRRNRLTGVAGLAIMAIKRFVFCRPHIVRQHADHRCHSTQHQPIPGSVLPRCCITALLVVAVSWWPIGLAFVPDILHAFTGVARLTPGLRIKRLAWMEVSASVVFGLSLITVMRAFHCPTGNLAP